MKRREIQRTEWSEFFDSFSRQHEGWLATLQIFNLEIGAQVQEQELSFAGIVAAWDNRGGIEIAIMLGRSADDHVTHTIRDPIEVRVEQIDERADAVLAIKSEDGTITLLRFRFPILPEMVDGLFTDPNRPSL